MYRMGRSGGVGDYINKVNSILVTCTDTRPLPSKFHVQRLSWRKAVIADAKAVTSSNFRNVRCCGKAAYAIADLHEVSSRGCSASVRDPTGIAAAVSFQNISIRARCSREFESVVGRCLGADDGMVSC